MNFMEFDFIFKLFLHRKENIHTKVDRCFKLFTFTS